MRKYFLSALACLAAVPMAASAQTLVDTGPGAPLDDGGWSLFSSQGLGGKFTLTDAASIGSVEGWIGGDAGNSLHVSIFDGDQTPATMLYSDDFTSGDGGWQGAFGEHWNLAAGSYWAVFTSSTGSNWMPGGAANPLPAYSGFINNSFWTTGEQLSFGLRINAAAAVPEPASWAMMLAGFSLVGGAMRSRRRTQVSFG